MSQLPQCMSAEGVRRFQNKVSKIVDSMSVKTIDLHYNDSKARGCTERIVGA